MENLKLPTFTFLTGEHPSLRSKIARSLSLRYNTAPVELYSPAAEAMRAAFSDDPLGDITEIANHEERTDQFIRFLTGTYGEPFFRERLVQRIEEYYRNAYQHILFTDVEAHDMRPIVSDFKAFGDATVIYFSTTPGSAAPIGDLPVQFYLIPEPVASLSIAEHTKRFVNFINGTGEAPTAAASPAALGDLA